MRLRTAELMAVTANRWPCLPPTTSVDGKPLVDIIGTPRLPLEEWINIKQRVIQGGKNIIDLRGRSSFQSPAYLYRDDSRSYGRAAFPLASRSLCQQRSFQSHHDGNGNHYKQKTEWNASQSTELPKKKKELEKSYEHLCKLRDEVIEMGVMPPIAEWHRLNPYMDKKTC